MITFEEDEDFEAMLNLRPVVTDIAKVAASLKRLSILPDDVTERVPDEGSESTSNELLSLLPGPPKSIFFRVVAYEGNLGLNSLSQ